MKEPTQKEIVLAMLQESVALIESGRIKDGLEVLKNALAHLEVK